MSSETKMETIPMKEMKVEKKERKKKETVLTFEGWL
jgi:hypothetical protein